MSARLGVLLSGRGSNLQALQRAIDAGELPARIAVVISNEPEARGVGVAQDLGLPVVTIPHRGGGGREDHEQKVLATLAEAEVEWVCLAGYMRMLSPGFVAHYPGRILNVHPSLLPAFPGLKAQAQALLHGVRVSGCTVHLVDAGLDSGPIVDQRVVPVLDEDSIDTLSARILEQEHRAYPAALRRLLLEPWALEGQRVAFGAATASEREAEKSSPGGIDKPQGSAYDSPP